MLRNVSSAIHSLSLAFESQANTENSSSFGSIPSLHQKPSPSLCSIPRPSSPNRPKPSSTSSSSAPRPSPAATLPIATYPLASRPRFPSLPRTPKLSPASLSHTTDKLARLPSLGSPPSPNLLATPLSIPLASFTLHRNLHLLHLSCSTLSSQPHKAAAISSVSSRTNPKKKLLCCLSLNHSCSASCHLNLFFSLPANHLILAPDTATQTSTPSKASPPLSRRTALPTRLRSLLSDQTPLACSFLSIERLPFAELPLLSLEHGRRRRAFSSRRHVLVSATAEAEGNSLWHCISSARHSSSF